MHRFIDRWFYLVIWGPVRLAKRANSHQISFEKDWKLRPRGLLGSLWGLLGGLWGLLGGLLGALEAILRPKSHQDRLQDDSGKIRKRKSDFFGPLLGAILGPKMYQNLLKSVPRAIQNVIVFLIDLDIDFWSNLVPTWPHVGPPNPPKMDPSWV